MKRAVTDKDISGKGKDVVPDEEERSHPHAPRLPVEERVVDLNYRMGNLQTTVERLARGLKSRWLPFPDSKQSAMKNHQEVWHIGCRIFDQSCHEDPWSSSESFDEDPAYLKHRRLQEPIMGL